MFALTAKDRDRKAYRRGIRDLLKSTFNLSDEEVRKDKEAWLKWLDAKPREPRDLRELLEGDVRDSLKARALAILLAPRIGHAAFTWSEKGTSLRDYLFLSDSIQLVDLPPQLRDFAFELLERGIKIALPKYADEDLRRTLGYYNRLILQALKLLDETEPRAERLFGLYQINDPVTFNNMDDASGYNPIERIFHSTVPEKWKGLADQRMRQVVLAELEGRAEPRVDWEKALEIYTRRVTFGLFTKKRPYSAAVFVSQVEFLMEMAQQVPPRVHFNHFNDLQNVLHLLRNRRHKKLRHQFVRHVILTDFGDYHSFRVYSEETLAVAKALLKEYADDAELSERLTTAIASGEATVRENQAAKQAHHAVEAAVMAEMR